MADDLTIDEAKAIRFDPSHPQHAAYLQGDAEVRGRIDAVYQKTYGFETDEPPEATDTPLDPQLQAMKDQYEQNKVAIPETLSEDARVSWGMLQQQWGPEFATNHKAFVEAASTLPAHDVHALEGVFEGIGNDPDICDVLSRIGRGKWDFVPPQLVEKIERRYPGIGDNPQVQKLVEHLRTRFKK